MQARQLLVATLLAITAVGTMAQEIDRSETLQAKSLASTQAQAQARADVSGRTRASVVAETRNLQAEGQLKAVGERAEAPVVNVVPNTAYASSLTRADVRKDLAQWRSTHKTVVGELG